MQVVTQPARLVALDSARSDPAREPGEFVTTPDGTLHVVVRGSGPDVVLIHGVTDNAHTWHDVQDLLAGSARTHAVDLPGHGLSDLPDRPLEASEMAEWIGAYLEQRGIDRAVVVGWSLGGAVALALSALHAARVSAVVFEAPAVLEFPFPNALFPLKLPGSGEVMPLIASVSGPRRFFMSSTFAPGFSPPEEVVERYWRGWQIKGRARYVRALLRDFEGPATTPFIEQVRAPAWVVHGDQDAIVPAGVGRELAGRLSKADLVALAGVGHAPHIERPDAMLEAVRAALATG